MAYFDFSALIKQYSTPFLVEISTEGGYDEYGDWKDGTVERHEMTGAIIAHRESKIFRSEGTLTSQDRALYMLNPLPEKWQGAKVIHENKVYTLSSQLQNAKFTGVWNYSLKYVSVFQGGV